MKFINPKKYTSEKIELIINNPENEQRLDLSLLELSIDHMVLSGQNPIKGKYLNTLDLITDKDSFLDRPSYILDEHTIYCCGHIIREIKEPSNY